MPLLRTSELKAVQSRHERVDVLFRVVRRERRADGALETEATEDRLRAVMSRTHRDAFAIEELAHFFGALTVEHERNHARFFRRVADDAKTANVDEALFGVLAQF